MSREKQKYHNGSLGSAGQPDSVSEKAVGFPPNNAGTANFTDGTAPYVRRLAELAATFDVLGELRNVEGNEESQSNWTGRDAGCHDAVWGKRARGARPSIDCAVRWEWSLFWRERSDDCFKARVAPQRVPKWTEAQMTVGHMASRHLSRIGQVD